MDPQKKGQKASGSRYPCTRELPENQVCKLLLEVDSREPLEDRKDNEEGRTKKRMKKTDEEEDEKDDEERRADLQSGFERTL